MEITLNGHEARVLGVLVEKGYSTPDQYPLSLNAVTNGCNQKSNRDPIVDFSEAEVRVAIQGLRMKGLLGVSVPAGSRVEKYRHNAKETLKCEDKDLAVLAELLLRGPQTAAELKTRASRMRDIPSKEMLDEVVTRLIDKRYARELPGGRATRFVQTLCANLHVEDEDAPAARGPAAPRPSAPAAPGSAAPGLEARVEALERTVAELTARLDRLTEELGA